MASTIQTGHSLRLSPRSCHAGREGCGRRRTQPATSLSSKGYAALSCSACVKPATLPEVADRRSAHSVRHIASGNLPGGVNCDNTGVVRVASARSSG